MFKSSGAVREFIQENYKPYIGGGDFLAPPTPRTLQLLDKVAALLRAERVQGRPWVDLERISGIMSFPAGYIDPELEVIVGLQTDQPLKRMMNPYGGIRMVEDALSAYGYEMAPQARDQMRYIRTHNEAVFSAYTDEMRRARSSGLLSGLPDAYGRGRIIGDYRRVSLFGVDALMAEKAEDLKGLAAPSDCELAVPIRREQVARQIEALQQLKAMAALYGRDISKPAKNALEAVQHLYFAYLAGVKENNGAAMSLGRVATFLDIYIEVDLETGLLTEAEAQELIDQLVIKLRLVRHLRTPEYDALFAGDPNWVTEALGGMGVDGRTLVTRTTYRFLHTLTNLGASPEPNMTVLWSNNLPSSFKQYCAKLSIATSALQFENDDLMRPHYGDDYGVACCVSAMKLGEQMQFFGARCNLPKVLLYAINGGVDEVSGRLVLEGVPRLLPEDSTVVEMEGASDIGHEGASEIGHTIEGAVVSPIALDYQQVETAFFALMERVAGLYVETMNTIHTMHDRYAYEASLMALHDTQVSPLMAFGIAGLSIVADSLSALRYAKVYPVLKAGRVVDYVVEGDFPKYGNDDARVDELAINVVQRFSDALKRTPAYMGARHTLSVLTITSNVVYGKKTGATPDGRKAFQAFAPGANPLHGREERGPLASMKSVAKIPYHGCAEDGISYTFSLVPSALGKGSDAERQRLLASLIDGYFLQGGHHINVNVLDKAVLLEAMDKPEAYPNLTIRVSGYAVNFNKLTREQQLEVISRCYHQEIA